MDSCSSSQISSTTTPPSAGGGGGAASIVDNHPLVLSLKHRYFESRQAARALKQQMREQRERSRKLIVAVALKLQEKEGEIEKVRYLLIYKCFLSSVVFQFE